MIYVFVGIGGMVGAVLRYGVSLLTVSFWSYPFPLATLVANWIGCLMLPVFVNKMKPGMLQKAVTTGVIGSFTTFSAFSVETVNLVQSGNGATAFLYIFLSITGGFLCVRLGLKVSEAG